MLSSQKNLINESVTNSCDDKITPVEFKFSIEDQSILLRQGNHTSINGINIYLGTARKVEYGGKCLDNGMNCISFIAVNSKIK